MPIAAKISLMNRTEKALGSVVTAEDLNTIMRIMADLLQGTTFLRPPEGRTERTTCWTAIWTR